MTILNFTRIVAARPEAAFDRIADLRGYPQWLPHSAAFLGTTCISDGPIGAGTSYVEDSPRGTRHGRITEFAPPVRIAFEQPMTMRPGFTGRIGIRVLYRILPDTEGARVERRLELEPYGPVRLLMPFIVPAFRAENERIMDGLARSFEIEAGCLP